MGRWTGEMIRIRRRDLGLSQSELARRAGMTQGYVSLLERGKGASPGALAALAAVLELQPDEHEVPPRHPALLLEGPRIPAPQSAGARLSVQVWARPSPSGDLIMVCPVGPRATLIAAIDVAGHGPGKHAVATWLAGWLRGRLAGSPGVPRTTELWAGLWRELNAIDEGAAFFMATLERWSESHHVRYEALVDGYPPPLLLVGQRRRAMESCRAPRSTSTGRSAPQPIVHGDLRPPWRLVIASDGLLYRVGGGEESSGHRWLRRWQTGPRRDLPLDGHLESSMPEGDDESMALICWNEWDIDMAYDPLDRVARRRLQMAVERLASSFATERKEGIAQALTEVLSNVARYASTGSARLRARRLDDGTVTVRVEDTGPGPRLLQEGVGIIWIRDLCDHVDIRENSDHGTTIEIEMRPGGKI